MMVTVLTLGTFTCLALAMVVAVASLINLALLALDERCISIRQWSIRSDSFIKRFILCIVGDVLVKLLTCMKRSLHIELGT